MAVRKTEENKAKAKAPAARKPAARKTTEVIIQSPMGGNITPEEILARVGKGKVSRPGAGGTGAVRRSGRTAGRVKPSLSR